MILCSGCIPNYQPGLTPEILALTREPDALRARSPSSPRLAELGAAISGDEARSSWIDRVESCSQRHDTGQFWSLLRSLSGKKPSHSPNQPISFGPHTLTAKVPIARAFCSQFTEVPGFRRSRESRALRRSVKDAHPLDQLFSPFTTDQVRAAIQASGSSRAHGPDLLTIFHLHNLGPAGLDFLCSLFNLSLSSASIPAIWKSANIIAIPKPSKPVSCSSSYRPISLLSPVAKVLERLLLPTLNDHLRLTDSQHGF